MLSHNMTDNELLNECDRHFGNELITELASRLSDTIDERDDYLKQNEELEDRLGELEAQVLQLQRELEDANDEIQSLQSQD